MAIGKLMFKKSTANWLICQLIRVIKLAKTLMYTHKTSIRELLTRRTQMKNPKLYMKKI